MAASPIDRFDQPSKVQLTRSGQIAASTNYFSDLFMLLATLADGVTKPIPETHMKLLSPILAGALLAISPALALQAQTTPASRPASSCAHERPLVGP